MEKRKLIVSSLDQAKRMIEAFLAANALPMHGALNVMFGWFYRNLEEDDEVGCPCFVYDYGPFEDRTFKTSNILIYVKIFANKDLNVTKLYQISPHKRMFFDEVKDGDGFDMVDAKHRYNNQHFIYKDGCISEVE